MKAAPVESIFARSWDLLTRNWIIIVPGLIVAVVVGVLTDFVNGTSSGYSVNDPTTVTSGIGHGILALVAGLVALLGFVLNTAYTTGMAGAAWRNGTTRIADGSTAFQRDAGNIITAMIGLFLIGIVAVFLAIFTLGLSLLAYLFLFIYTMPAAVVGEVGGFASLGESYKIATRRFVTTLIMVVVIAVFAVFSGVIAGLFSFAPFLGPIVAQIVSEVVVAYFTLVIVGEYLNLRPLVDEPPVSRPSL